MDAFDFRAKRRELLAMWQECFALFQGVVDSAKAGETVLRASMAKEINAFMKMSTEILDKMEAEEERARLAQGYAPQGAEFMGDPDLEDLDGIHEPLKTE
jgi:hypothetical protein